MPLPQGMSIAVMDGTLWSLYRQIVEYVWVWSGMAHSVLLMDGCVLYEQKPYNKKIYKKYGTQKWYGYVSLHISLCKPWLCGLGWLDVNRGVEHCLLHALQAIRLEALQPSVETLGTIKLEVIQPSIESLGTIRLEVIQPSIESLATSIESLGTIRLEVIIRLEIIQPSLECMMFQLF